MANIDYDKLIGDFLKRVRLPDNVLGASRIPVRGAIEEAIKARRKGDKADCKKWTKHALAEVGDLRVYDDKQMKAFAGLLQDFIKKHGYFSYKAALKKRAGEITKLSGLFKKKGVAAAQSQAQQIHSQMVNSGELPDTSSFDEFDREVAKIFSEMPPLLVQTPKVVGQIKWAGILSRFKLSKAAAGDLQQLATDMMKHGAYDPKSIKAAKAILAASGDAKAKGTELVGAIHDEICDVMI